MWPARRWIVVDDEDVVLQHARQGQRVDVGVAAGGNGPAVAQRVDTASILTGRLGAIEPRLCLVA
jgi:hypothetical protein